MTRPLDTQLPPIRVSAAFLAAIEDLAEAEQRPLSQMVRILIERGMSHTLEQRHPRGIVKARTPKQIAAAKRHARLVAEG